MRIHNLCQQLYVPYQKPGLVTGSYPFPFIEQSERFAVNLAYFFYFYCFICCPTDSSILEASGLEPRPFTELALTAISSHPQTRTHLIQVQCCGSESGSINQRRGSADPDPHQNVMDPQHCPSQPFLLIFRTWCPARLAMFSCMISGAGTSPLPTATRHHNLILPDAFESS
jgi:hypothetical protein